MGELTGAQAKLAEASQSHCGGWGIRMTQAGSVEEEEVGTGAGGRRMGWAALIQLLGALAKVQRRSGAAEEVRSALELQRLAGEEAQCAAVLACCDCCGGVREHEGDGAEVLEA